MSFEGQVGHELVDGKRRAFQKKEMGKEKVRMVRTDWRKRPSFEKFRNKFTCRTDLYYGRP